MSSLKMKKGGILRISRIMAICVLQHNSWEREMCMDFMQKSTQISSDDMESFIFCNIDLVQMHREAFLKVF